MEDVTNKIRKILSDAMGANDNGGEETVVNGCKQQKINMVFNAPITIVSKDENSNGSD